MSSCFSRCLRVPIAIPASYESYLWILQTLLLTHPDLHPGLLASTWLRMGSKFLCIRSTPTEMQSIGENDFECLASTGVKSPATAMFEQIDTQEPPQCDPLVRSRGQSAENEIADLLETRIFTACGHDFVEPNSYGCLKSVSQPLPATRAKWGERI
jgi:hypothetical protein